MARISSIHIVSIDSYLTESDVKDIFEYGEIGRVSQVEFTPIITDGYDWNLKSAVIHFEEFYDNFAAIYLLCGIETYGTFIYHLDNMHYWILSKNKNLIPENQFEAKHRILEESILQQARVVEQQSELIKIQSDLLEKLSRRIDEHEDHQFHTINCIFRAICDLNPAPKVKMCDTEFSVAFEKYIGDMQEIESEYLHKVRFNKTFYGTY